MNKAMEKMISRDLGMNINQIRKSPWNELFTRPYGREKAFQRQNSFLSKI